MLQTIHTRNLPALKGYHNHHENLPYPYDTPDAIDGDAHDYRPVDGDRRGNIRGGLIVALKAKGDAKHDTSGFVLR